MLALQQAGYACFMPFGGNTRCDLVIESAGRLVRVQCKSGRLRAGAVLFAVCSCYGHQRNPETTRRDYLGQIDFFAVYCPDTAGAFLVPIADVPTRSCASLRVHPRGTTSASKCGTPPTTRLRR
jgi:PD-(D/E)XK endonuclease